ncbi:MAG: hypothetical protein P4L33_14120 [Capsulimonadaceae bacterium]|nr:hypothetical protein [Capsulimonadaceae bacterium]
MKRLILEMSLKPFYDTGNEAVEKVTGAIVRQWAPLIDQAQSVSVLFWTADGSEILEYDGRLTREIEWAKWIGIANTPPHDSGKRTLHDVRVPYRDNPPAITYERLRAIVQTVKSTIASLTGKPVTLGTIFDPGPEFSESQFKYVRHKEIAGGATMGEGRWVSCAAVLKGDHTPYAAYPDGIPDGTSLATFLGAQSRRFIADMGFDYLWLSNGFGFALAAWSVTGQVFDGTRFDAAAAPDINRAILSFWREFRATCPDVPVETRGTNLSTGMDLSSDATPMRDIYRGEFNLIAPPNSPWAALDGDYGLEITGWLSHIAELPANGIIPFRYYIHDPWWLNSPWLDRYGREPHDIYLPLSCGRIASDGRVQTPDSVSLLTIDDSYGRTPDQVPTEVIPRINEALRDAPDAPGLVTWIYPFDEYHDWTFASPSRASEVFFGDWFMRAAVNQGFPLNTVASTSTFLSSRKARKGLYDGTVLVCPAPDAGTPLAAALMEHLDSGGKALLYGPLGHADPGLLSRLELSFAGSISGELDFRTAMPGDTLSTGSYPSRIQMRETLSGGGADTILAPSSGARVLAEAASGQNRRVFAAIGGGSLAWVRGAFCETITGGQLPRPDDQREWFPAARLMRWALAELGYALRFEKNDVGTPDPVVLAAKCRNGWFFSGFSRSTNVRLRWKFPIGVPIPVGCDVQLDGDAGSISLPRAWHRECRVFVQQSTPGEVTCREVYSGEIGITRRLAVGGLSNARVTFLPDSTAVIEARLQKNVGYLGSGPAIEDIRREADTIVAGNVNGELLISW